MNIGISSRHFQAIQILRYLSSSILGPNFHGIFEAYQAHHQVSKGPLSWSHLVPQVFSSSGAHGANTQGAVSGWFISGEIPW